MQKIIHVKGHPERFLYLEIDYMFNDGELYYILQSRENEDVGSIILSKEGIFYGSFEIESLLQGHGEYEMGEIKDD